MIIPKLQNECEFGKAKCKNPELIQTPCPEEISPQRDCDAVLCADIYDPVCDQCGIEYGVSQKLFFPSKPTLKILQNSCEFNRSKCKNSKLVQKPCQNVTVNTTDCDRACIALYDPVCDQCGNIYGVNIAKMHVEQREREMMDICVQGWGDKGLG